MDDLCVSRLEVPFRTKVDYKWTNKINKDHTVGPCGLSDCGEAFSCFCQYAVCDWATSHGNQLEDVTSSPCRAAADTWEPFSASLVQDLKNGHEKSGQGIRLSSEFSS